jgi:hypothetical protein
MDRVKKACRRKGPQQTCARLFTTKGAKSAKLKPVDFSIFVSFVSFVVI